MRERLFASAACIVKGFGLCGPGTPQQYVETAVALAGDGTRLAQLHSTQRERFKAPSLGTRHCSCNTWKPLAAICGRNGARQRLKKSAGAGNYSLKIAKQDGLV